MSKVDPKTEVVRLKPYQYVHIQDNNENTTRTIVGPTTFTRKEHEQVLIAPSPCITIPPNFYCIIENPVSVNANGDPVTDPSGQVKVRQGDREIRFAQQPFPLYPGEVLVGDVRALDVLAPNTAIRAKALRDFEDKSADGKTSVKRSAGDEWLIYGPCTYIPRIDVDVVTVVNAQVIGPNQGLKLRARNSFTDRTGAVRKAGEEWLYEKLGAYIPSVDEDVVEVISAIILTDKKSVHLEALRNFKCCLGKERKAGNQWLVTFKDRETYMPSPNERIVAEVPLICLNSRQYCVVQDYIDGKGTQRFGQNEVRKGPLNFFLHPGESLEGSTVRDVYVLGEDEALLLTSKEQFTDESGARRPGDKWMIRGPREYVPRSEVIVLERRKAIPLDMNEGVYIRDTITGNVRAHIGSTVLLAENEELWEKELNPLVEELLQLPRGTKVQSDTEAVALRRRNKTSVITYNVPHSSLCQIYDFKKKQSRTILGPDLVCLQPDEEFTLLSLSGGKPKQENYIRSLNLYLGPDFMTDILNVETSDHARLQLHLSYNWRFNYDPKVPEKPFVVPDFVGDACKALASRIRAAVAAESFDVFHKNSAMIIKAAVFGTEEGDSTKVKGELRFKSNDLIINNVDIHSVDPVDPKTREALTKSVQLAIEITTKSQEAVARHTASTLEQEARGLLERQVIEDKAKAEEQRKNVLQLEAENSAIESTGSSKAESKAIAESKLIESTNEVKLSEIKANIAKITAELEVALQQQKQEAELDYKEALDNLEVSKAEELAEIEANKFQHTIEAVGKGTIKAMATAGPALQARLLKGLGLQGYLVTDGSNPINLFNTAKGLTAPMK